MRSATPNPPAVTPILVTARQAAAALSVSERTLRELPIAKTKLPTGALRFRVADLEAFAQGCESIISADDSQPRHGKRNEAGQFARSKPSKRGGRMVRRLVESAEDSNQQAQGAAG